MKLKRWRWHLDQSFKGRSTIGIEKLLYFGSVNGKTGKIYNCLQRVRYNRHQVSQSCPWWRHSLIDNHEWITSHLHLLKSCYVSSVLIILDVWLHFSQASGCLTWAFPSNLWEWIVHASYSSDSCDPLRMTIEINEVTAENNRGSPMLEAVHWYAYHVLGGVCTLTQQEVVECSH